jgi:hypothetical protein
MSRQSNAKEKIMKGKYLRSLGVAALAIPLLAAAPAMADRFGDWDGNDDGVLDGNEFTTGFRENGAYDAWDADDDGSLTEDEFNDGVLGAYDDDGNDTLDELEFGNIEDDIGDGGLFDL